MKTTRAGESIFRGEQEAIDMRKTTLAVLGVAVLALAAGPSPGGAEPPSPGDRHPRRGRAESMARFLGLSEQQQEAVRELMEERRAEHQALREKMAVNREAMEQALDVANPDPAAVGERAIEAHRLRKQQRALREAQDDAIRELLTAEQKVKFDAMRVLREEGRGGPPEGGFGPRPARRSGEPRP
jgi:Spy/CpxP family protein refolding chaperone